ncbi:MAG: 2-hydroxyglutaryl-CoA dehydratase [Dehalococcoidales bacterium]|nr:2-hydroxyglutaryl-CoA dehydratase [Dehalococcoidales bacterium]
MFAGIDIGSVVTKAVILSQQEEILSFIRIPTGYNRRQSGDEAYRLVLQKAGKTPEDVKYVVTTGYGRRAVTFADKVLPEIVCHARGTRRLVPEVRTIIDIGGQDSKVIQLDDQGAVTRFEMNDKCAAGTGRFLEVLTERILNLTLDELGPLALKSTRDCHISSVCTVFAESEIVSLLSEKYSKEDIAWGMSRAIARRVIGMGKGGQISFEEPVVFSGGVSRNAGVVKAFKNELGKEVVTLEEPQITGALGAAVFAGEYSHKERG